MAGSNPYETGLDRNAANFVPLSPLSFLDRTAAVFPDRTAVVHGDIERSWAETRTRCLRLASALAQRGIGLGDTVAVMAPNVPARRRHRRLHSRSRRGPTTNGAKRPAPSSP